MKVKKFLKHVTVGTIINIYSEGDLLDQGHTVSIKRKWGEYEIYHVSCGVLRNPENFETPITGGVLWIELNGNEGR